MGKQNQILAQKLKNKELISGTVIAAGSPLITEMIAQCGYDVLWLDMEHSAIGIEGLVPNLMAARSGGTPVWVRVPWNDPVRVKPVLDMGADGIIFPFIRTLEDAQLAVASCTYPPEGIRGWGPLRSADYGAISQADYMAKYSRECLRILQIEHVDAVRDLRRIASLDGVDCLLVGPNDLSGSIGKLGQMWDDEVVELYREIGRVAREIGKPAAICAFNPAYIPQWIEMGFTVFFGGSDCAFVYQGAHKLLKDFNTYFDPKGSL